MINSQTNKQILRLNPFVFPSDTDFRFAILIVATLSASISIYYFLYLSVPVNATLDDLIFTYCYNQTETIRPLTIENYKPFTDMLTHCLTPIKQVVMAWIGLSLVLLLSVAGALYWALPNWKIWRGGLKPLYAAQVSPGMMTYLADLCVEAGLSRHPFFLLNPYNLTPGGVTFGRLGRYFVVLNSGLLMQFQTNPAVFRSIVLHELGHIRNADVDKTYFTVAIGWAFLLVALIPWIVYRLIPPWHIDHIFNEGWRILILAGLIYLTRKAILRTREVYADVRSSVWDGPSGALSYVLSKLPSPKGGRWLHLFQVHPDPKRRQQTLYDTSRLFGLNFWDVFVAGVVTATVVSDIEWLLSFPFLGSVSNASTSVLGSRVILAFLVAGIVGLGAWRAAFANQVRGLAPSGTLMLSLSLGMGLLFGQILSLTVYELGASNGILPVRGEYFTNIPDVTSLTGLTWSSSPSQWGSVLFWSIVLLLIVWFFFTWVVAGAVLWLKVASSSASLRRIYWFALVVESVVLCILFAQLSAVRGAVQFAQNVPDLYMHQFLSLIGVPDSIGGFAPIIYAIFELVSDPLMLLALMCLWAYPLASWFWRKRLARMTALPWAWLDPASHAPTMFSSLADVQERRGADPSLPPRPLAASPGQALLRPGLALGIGIAGGLVFCGIFIFLLKIGQLGLSVDQPILLAVLVQVCTAAIVAGTIRHHSVTHSLFAAWVAGCLMSLGLLMPNLLSSRGNLDQAWAIFREVISTGALATLPIAFVVSLLVQRTHRLLGQKPRKFF